MPLRARATVRWRHDSQQPKLSMSQMREICGGLLTSGGSQVHLLAVGGASGSQNCCNNSGSLGWARADRIVTVRHGRLRSIGAAFKSAWRWRRARWSCMRDVNA
eukprot:4274605-Prymnesium_polylepis.1